ncbi:MAG: alkylated DNA repair protein [Proteobacteria bacterium]|nr:MAG: alkylated DNA repair protein [Pseudomonadota bacterium]
MVRKLVILAVALGIVGGAAFWFLTAPARVSADVLSAYTPDLANGRTMFYAGGCASCHMTPGQDDKARLGGGLAMKTPFGTFYPPNISPDRNDGIGGWSEADFVTALWKGTSPDGQHYYPIFPYTSYQRMKLTDVRDLFAYLKTLPAIAGKVQAHDLPIHFKIRRTLGGWKLLFLDGRPFVADPSRSPEWNRGAYLANGPGHCAECHSPRNILGAIIQRQRFAGGPEAEGGDGWIPNITQAGIDKYSEHDIERVLEDGETPDGDTVGGAMGKVVGNTSKLSEEDRRAIATYIKSLPPVEGPKRP